MRLRSALSAIVLATLSMAVPATARGWQLEGQAAAPQVFATTKPAHATVNVVAVALTCEQVDDHRLVQLQLYPTRLQPLLPRAASRDELKDEPSAQLSIDGTTYPIKLGFGGEYVVLYDSDEDDLPFLSPALVDAMERGRSLEVRFDLLKDGHAGSARYDGELRIDLTAGDGSAAVAAVRSACRP